MGGIIGLIVFIVGLLINIKWLFSDEFNILGVPAYIFGLPMMGIVVFVVYLIGDNG